MKSCPHCGKELLSDAVVCQYCGYRYPPTSTSRFVLMLLAVASILGGAFGGPYLSDYLGITDPVLGWVVYAVLIFFLPAILFRAAMQR